MMRWLGAMVLGAVLFAGGVVTGVGLSGRNVQEAPMAQKVEAPAVGALPERLRQMLAPVCTEKYLIQLLEEKLDEYKSHTRYRDRPDLVTLENITWFLDPLGPWWASTRDVWFAACLTVLSAK